MKVEQIIVKNGDDDFEDYFVLKVDGREVISVGNFAECPEDANLVRGLSFVKDIGELMKKAHESKDFTLECSEEEEEEL